MMPDIIDVDCEVGECHPTLVVEDSVPSSPACIDSPVTAGSTGVLSYSCAGGPVSAVLGQVTFAGSVSGGDVGLSGSVQVVGPDNCLWLTNHSIQGSLLDGKLTYSYAEVLLTDPPTGCWSPCTEVGNVEIEWVQPL